MTRTPLLIMLAAAAALAGCNSENQTIAAGGPDGNQDANASAAQQVELPPSIAASKTYRCKDNTIVYVDWLSDGSARVKKSQDDAGTLLANAATELKGDQTAASISFGGQSCKA